MSDGMLAGERVLVTGGSGGLGRGICEVAAREGARVAFCWHRNAAGAKETEESVRALGAEVLAIQADLTEPKAAQEVVAAVEAEWEGIDGLVNNAGFSEAIPFVLLEDEDMQDLLELNLLAPFRLTRAAVRGMLRRKHGRIVNLSSITGSRTIPGPVHYATSKGALEAFTRSLAHEVGAYGILVNAVAAGIFEGGLKSTIPEHHQQRYLNASSLSRFGTPAECGELVSWLLSRKNSYMNGSVVYQEGGTL